MILKEGQIIEILLIKILNNLYINKPILKFLYF
jgi:hypothetical protein